MRYIFCITILISSLSISAQKNIIGLHPIVGDTIDQNEKDLYFLFDNIDDSTFIEAYIYQDNESLWLATKQRSGKIIYEIDSQYITDNYNRIIKINEYYDYLSHKDSIEINDSPDITEETVSFSISDQKMQQIKKNARRYQHLKAEAERKGLWGDDKENYIKSAGYWELYCSDK